MNLDYTLNKTVFKGESRVRGDHLSALLPFSPDNVDLFECSLVVRDFFPQDCSVLMAGYQTRSMFAASVMVLSSVRLRGHTR